MIALVATVHVALASQESVGAAVTVVAAVERVWAPAVNVVEVAVMFHPVPDPVASPTSRAWVVVGVWSRPFNVADQLTFGGVETNARLPALIVAVPVVAAAGRLPASATLAAAAVTSHTRRRPRRNRPCLCPPEPSVPPGSPCTRHPSGRHRRDRSGHRAAHQCGPHQDQPGPTFEEFIGTSHQDLRNQFTSEPWYDTPTGHRALLAGRSPQPDSSARSS